MRTRPRVVSSSNHPWICCCVALPQGNSCILIRDGLYSDLPSSSLKQMSPMNSKRALNEHSLSFSSDQNSGFRERILGMPTPRPTERNGGNLSRKKAVRRRISPGKPPRSSITHLNGTVPCTSHEAIVAYITKH